MVHDRPALIGGRPVRPQGEPTWPPPDPNVDAVLRRLAGSGEWGRYEGPHCDRLERRLAELHDVGHVRLLSSGTAAVECALRGVGVQAGDEVILAAWDFKANFANVVALGATPVLVDVRRDDAQLNIDLVASAVTKRTKAVLASHLHGSVVDMPTLLMVCEHHGLSLIEDVCQMPLADVSGRVAGTWGHVGTLSFGGSKTLSAGRGGAIITRSRQIAQRIQLHDWRGNRLSPLSEIQAALLWPQLDAFAERKKQRQRAAAWFRDAFADCNGLQPLPEPPSDTDYYKVPFWYSERAFSVLRRARFCDAMHAEGVTMSPSFPALHETHSAKRFRSTGDLANASRAGREIVVLHHPVLLEDEPEWQLVRDAVEKIRAHAGELSDDE